MKSVAFLSLGSIGNALPAAEFKITGPLSAASPRYTPPASDFKVLRLAPTASPATLPHHLNLQLSASWLKSRLRPGYCTPHFLCDRKRAVLRPKEAPGLQPWTCCGPAKLHLRLRRGRQSAEQALCVRAHAKPPLPHPPNDRKTPRARHPGRFPIDKHVQKKG